VQVINRILATLLALALFLGGLLAVVDIVLVQLQRAPFLVPVGRWAAWLRSQAFDAGIVRAVCVGLAVVGLLLLVAGLRRGRPGTLTLPSRQEGVRVTAARRELERALAAAARRVDGVAGAHARARRRSVRVVAATPLRDPGELTRQVTDVVAGRLGELGLTDVVRPRVSVSTAKGAR
jgi:uncharacterized protein DUF6286